MRNHHGVRRPTEEAAMKNLSKNARMRKTLTVAKLAIELCMEELGRR